MIRLQNMTCGYGKKVVLSEISLQIEGGHLTCLLGQNGAGKTTLFKTILGFIRPFEGTVFINEKPLHRLHPKELARAISYVPQAHATPFPYTAFDVVLMGRFVYSEGLFGLPDRKSRKIVHECFNRLEIEHLKDQYFSSLSGGEKQMVLIARAMAQQPLFIAMDEPTSNLDLGNQARVMNIAMMLKEQGYGVIMNTHAPEQALNYADKVILLQNGKIRDSGSPGEIMNSALISEIYKINLELVSAKTTDGKDHQVCVAI